MDLSLAAAMEPPNNADNGDDGSSGEDKEQPDPPHKKRRYRRHTEAQIQRLEAFFEKDPYPDGKQRNKLAVELGLEPQQIRFWFQNKHTQLKTQREKNANTLLKLENENLRAENMLLREAHCSAICTACIGSNPQGEYLFGMQRLMLENSRLKEQVRKMQEEVENSNLNPMLD